MSENVIVTSEGEFTGYLYVMKLFEEEGNEIIRPENIIETRKKIISEIY
jgi:hypothetical protein